MEDKFTVTIKTPENIDELTRLKTELNLHQELRNVLEKYKLENKIEDFSFKC